VAVLVLGGARSGKSRYAENLATASQKTVIYIATGQAKDTEMAARIERHQQDRPVHWQTVEEPIQLSATLEMYAQDNRCLLVDCLTLWLSNILFNAQGQVQEAVFKQQSQALLNTVKTLAGQVIFVSNEVGQGVVPMDAMSRRFVDEAGRLHQQLAQRCEQVVFVTAGLAQVLK
jgi:adenosylcobinamide kinase / adenosylcobinamide-phosphate guanylyltransferase